MRNVTCNGAFNIALLDFLMSPPLLVLVESKRGTNFGALSPLVVLSVPQFSSFTSSPSALVDGFNLLGFNEKGFLTGWMPEPVPNLAGFNTVILLVFNGPKLLLSANGFELPNLDVDSTGGIMNVFFWGLMLFSTSSLPSVLNSTTDTHKHEF